MATKWMTSTNGLTIMNGNEPLKLKFLGIISASTKHNKLKKIKT
jgi:hypothetical protein